MEFSKLLSEDHNLTDVERRSIEVIYHRQVMDWLFDGVIFPVLYAMGVLLAINYLCDILGIILK